MSFKSGYWQKYWIPKAIILSRVALFLMCGLSAMYIALEIERNRELSGATKVRLVLLALGIALAIMSFSSLFKSYYTPVVMIATLAGTIGTSLVISDTGVFGQTLFQLGVFLVIRLPFLSQLVCSVVGLAVWVAVASASGLATSSSTANDDAGGIFEFVVYLAFVVAFSALGARNLHNAMYGDYTEQNRLRQEQNAFNDVLGNMLPSNVIKRLEQQSAGLKVWGGLFWEKEPDLSVVFCDIANFDELIDARTPYQLVELLDRVYTLLDVLSVKHGVSKMETVGKTWMGCAGLHGSGENHAAKAVAFGKDALRTVARLRTDEHEQLICLRIGIHTGEAVAGVVGLKKPQFCLFGDTVNTASRMQSTGQTGAVHVSAMTHTAISSLYQFHERQVSVKGKGLMTTYFVGQVLTTGLSDKGSIRQNSTSMIQSTTSSRLGSSNNPTPETDGAFESLLSSLIEVAVGFSQTPLERRYAAEQRTIGAKNAAIAFFFMVLFQVFRLLEIFFISSNERQSVRSVVARAVTLFLCVLSNVLLTMYSASELISFRGRLMFMCSLVAISLAMLSSESIAWRACLDHIFLFAVAAFCGVLSSAESALVNMACAVLFCVASGAPLPWYGLAGGGLPLDYTTAFFCLASVCVVAVSACGEEVYLRRLYKRKLAATRETKRIHAILFKMLPRQIVEQLKEGRKARGQLHSNVTLLFMDVKGFTTISASISPSQVVQLVNSLFSDYDRLSAKHGVFKVQTIGDAYVACAGLPYADAEVDIDFAEESDGDGDQTDSADLTSTEPNTQSRKSKYTEAEVSRLQSSMYGKRSSIRQKFSAMKSRRRYTVTEQPGRRSTIQSARAMLALAQDMHKCSKRIKDPATGKSIQIRVGLHTGTIVAGVIGTKTLRFDIWGPHVIAGNMMESNGIPGQTVVSSYAREYLEGVDGVRFEEHVQVNVRGLGAIETFVAKRAPRASIARDD